MQKNAVLSLRTKLLEEFPFWRNLTLIVVFFAITPLALGASLFSLLFLADKPVNTDTPAVITDFIPRSGVRVYASIPSTFPTVSGWAVSSDARVEMVRQFLESYKSPLEPLAGLIVAISDQYGLDHRLTTAIAMKESGLCKIIPDNTFNCWGWGIHSEGTLGFDSYEQGIETVSAGLKENYIDKGYLTVEDIMTKYAHPDSTTWANGVNFYMAQME